MDYSHINSDETALKWLHSLSIAKPQNILPILTQIAKLLHNEPVLSLDAQNTVRQLINARPYLSYVQKNVPNASVQSALETLVAFLQLKRFDLTVLGKIEEPSVQSGSYAEALWQEAKATLALKTPDFQADKSFLPTIQQVCQVRDFINQVRNRQSEPLEDKGIYLELDCILAEEQIICVEYVPQNWGQNISSAKLITESLIQHSNHLKRQMIAQTRQIIEVWVDRTVELNSLLGNFVCRQRFGEFEYVKGPLAYAMQQGLTVVFNNAEQASNELILQLRSLANDGMIRLNQRTLYSHSDFRAILVCAKGSRKVSQSIVFLKQSPLRAASKLPAMSNRRNKQLLTALLDDFQSMCGYHSACRLLERAFIVREQFLGKSRMEDEFWEGYSTEEYQRRMAYEAAELAGTAGWDKHIEIHGKYKQLTIGRVTLPTVGQARSSIVPTQYSLAVLERLMMCHQAGECPLLVSQTGCGKTTLVQYLAQLCGCELHVYNMSAGTDPTDLVGGFKPIDCRLLLRNLYNSFVDKFSAQVNGAEKNAPFLQTLLTYFQSQRWEVLLKSMIQSVPKIIGQLTHLSFADSWKEIQAKAQRMLANLDRIDSNLVFSFVEANLTKAIQQGHWVLVDQINLASNDVLQKLVPLIEGKSIMLYEKGDLVYLQRHKNFRIIACMNPSNDAGKKPLPPNLAEKFTIITLTDPKHGDIEMITQQLCPQLPSTQIADLYFQLKKVRPLSMRNLSRALSYIRKNKESYSFGRAVYDGLVLGFGDKTALIKYKNEAKPKVPPGKIDLSGFLVHQGPYEITETQQFYLTATFQEHLSDLLRAVAGTDLPVLLEGPTSVGKTSLIRYVASKAGYKCVRINNHQHTQIEEYIGNYFPDVTGRLVFRQGPLVQAVRNGYWLILDELNLARTEILECLNRLLDDNRQLFIPEQQKHVKPHPSFRIFATQNPSSYSGRKTLSRAFRNRFVCLTFEAISGSDTMSIVEARCPLLRDSKGLAKTMKTTLDSLSSYRQRQKIFAKDSLITIRDLIKWAGRSFSDKESFILDGYMILAERLRCPQERQLVNKVLLNSNTLTYDALKNKYQQIAEQNLSAMAISQTVISVQMNKSFERMAAVTLRAIQNNQPVLLVGQTGCGKTTLAQLIAAVSKRPFYSLNCHKHTEASDLLGSLRPSKDPSRMFEFVNGVVVEAMLNGGVLLIDEINTAEDSVLERLNQLLECGSIGIERGNGWEVIDSCPGFCVIATMNPSGDYGKRELSPALRNRFTQIWVSPITHPSQIMAARTDIVSMIQGKLSSKPQHKTQIANWLYQFIVEFNCNLSQKLNGFKRFLTMRDIGWVCRFLLQQGHVENLYSLALTILTVEALRFGDSGISISQEQEKKVVRMLAEAIKHQCAYQQVSQIDCICLVMDLGCPLMLKTDLPVQLLGVQPQRLIFFNQHTDLSELVGQFHPCGSEFVWKDGPLVAAMRNGETVILQDLNLAQQQVIEGINSLFDHRGSLFIVELNQTVHKHPTFKPIVVLSHTVKNDRKGLPNSFLNRFVKLCIKDVPTSVKISFLKKKHPQLTQAFWQHLEPFVGKGQIRSQMWDLLCQLGRCSRFDLALKLLSVHSSESKEQLEDSNESLVLQHLPLKDQFAITSCDQVDCLVGAVSVLRNSTYSICLEAQQSSQLKQIAQCIGYLAKKRIRTILLSTQCDSVDLLGSYEQKTDGSTGLAAFMYVESQIVKCLQDPSTILCVQVSHESMLERLQKGLLSVYLRQKQILVLLVGSNNEKQGGYISGFVRLKVPFSPTATKDNIFIANMSKFQLYDEQLRHSQRLELISEMMDEAGTDRTQITAWKAVRTMEISNQQLFLQSLQKKITETEQSKFNRQYGMVWANIQMLAQSTKTNRLLEDIQATLPRTKQQQQVRLEVLALLTSNTAEMNTLLPQIRSETLQANPQTLYKFQQLYVCNFNNFRSTVAPLLGTLIQRSSAQEGPRLLRRFYSQVQRLYVEMCSSELPQLLVQFTEEQYRLVTIQSTQPAVSYNLFKTCPPSVRSIWECVPNSYLALSSIEQAIGSIVKHLRVDFTELGEWIHNARVGSYAQLKTLLTERVNADFTLLHSCRQLLSRQVEIVIPETNSWTDQQVALTVYSVFRPKPTIEENIAPFVQPEMQQAIEIALNSNLQALQSVYHEYCRRCYSGYKSIRYHKLQSYLTSSTERLRLLREQIVYRSDDNLQSLQLVFSDMMAADRALLATNYEPNKLKQVIIDLYVGHHVSSSDIVLPYIFSLILMLPCGQQSKWSSCLTLPTPQLVIKEILKDEEEEAVDAARKYHEFRRRFNRNVIIDEYTEEAEQRHKQITQTEIAELFGQRQSSVAPTDEAYYLLMQSVQPLRNYLTSKVLHKASDYPGWLVGTAWLLRRRAVGSACNIYQESDPELVSELTQPIINVLLQVKNILSQYGTDLAKGVATLCRVILDHSLFTTPLYRVLSDCQQLIERLDSLNTTLPQVLHVLTRPLIDRCLFLRKLQLKNWKLLIEAKIGRAQRSDAIELIPLYRLLQEKPNSDQLFFMADKYIRQSRLICLPFRMAVIRWVIRQTIAKEGDLATNPSLGSLRKVYGFYSALMPEVQKHELKVRNDRLSEMKEYEGLAGWHSDQFLIFKATCDKFHRKIHSILKKYQEETSSRLSDFHQQLREKLIFDSVQDFVKWLEATDHLQKDSDELATIQENQSSNGDGNKDNNSPKSQPEKDASEKVQHKQDEQQLEQMSQVSLFQSLYDQLVETIRSIRGGQHTSQSRLLVIRQGLAYLEEQIPKKGNQTNYKQSMQGQAEKNTIIEQPNINNGVDKPSQTNQSYHLGVLPNEIQQIRKKYWHYYFAVWDRLSQRCQSIWNRQIVDRIWGLVDRIWKLVESQVGLFVGDLTVTEKGPQQLMLGVLEVGSSFDLHKCPLVKSEMDKIALKVHTNSQKHQKQTENGQTLYNNTTISHNQPLKLIPSNICVSYLPLVRLGSLLGSVAINLQKKGLCVKQQERECEEGDDDIQDGMGMGTGQAHEGAQNVGEQIEFEEQLRGLEGEEDQGGGEDRDEDRGKEFEMKGDMDGGESYEQQSKSQKQSDKQGEEDIGEQMGEVDAEQRQQDVKDRQAKEDDKGKLNDQDDIEIEGQKNGEEEIVDNEHLDKENRQAQEVPEDQGQANEQRSDWSEEGSNNSGDQVNKRDENAEQQDASEGDNSVDYDASAQEKAQNIDSGDEDQQSGQADSQNNQQEPMEQEQQIDADEDGSNAMEEQAPEQPPVTQQSPPSPRHRSSRKEHQAAYGRTDMQRQHQSALLNNADAANGSAQNEPSQQQQSSSAQPMNAQAANQQVQTQRPASHSLSSELIKEILQQQYKEQKNDEVQQRLKGNVTEKEGTKDIEEQAMEEAEEQGEYRLAEQDEQVKAVMQMASMMEEEDREQTQEDKRKQAEEQGKDAEGQNNQQDKKESKVDPSGDKAGAAAKPKQDQNTDLVKKPKHEEKRQKLQQNAFSNSSGSQLTDPKVSQKSKKESNNSEQTKKTIINSIELQVDDQVAIIKPFQGKNLLQQALEVSRVLQEQLKSVFEPLNAAQYRGDFRTGKKLNLRKIIPFIASNFKKDRIWLRRAQPTERDYNVMLALDDTKSMSYGGVGESALKGLLSLEMALERLGIKTGVCALRDHPALIKDFNLKLEPSELINRFSFLHESASSHDNAVPNFLASCMEAFRRVCLQGCVKLDSNAEGIASTQQNASKGERTEKAVNKGASRNMNTALINNLPQQTIQATQSQIISQSSSNNLCFIISDGRLNKALTRPLLRHCAQQDIACVFIIIDSNPSVLDIRSVEKQDGKMTIKPYMEDFPFEYYVIVKEVKDLGDVLVQAVMQFVTRND